MSQPLSHVLQPTPPVLSVEKPPLKRNHQTFYAIVQFDFVAERPDELDAKAGEPISVVAQSNREWFVAKPIGRLGGPGLIPAAFVELRDPATGRQMSEAEVGGLMDQGARSQTYAEAQAQEDEVLPPGILTSASIPSFHRESGEYWFRLNIEFQPDPETESSSFPPLVSMVLYRNYEDFYAFQLELLDTFPVEAGRKKRDPQGPELTENDRILPYMPGPVDHVDDAVTASRQHDLDIYVRELVELTLPQYDAEHVLRCDLIRRFLAQKAGDIILPSPKHSTNPVKAVESSVDMNHGVEHLKLEDESNPSPDRYSHYSDYRGNGEATEIYPVSRYLHATALRMSNVAL